jgi:hypothetical protein
MTDFINKDRDRDYSNLENNVLKFKNKNFRFLLNRTDLCSDSTSNLILKIINENEEINKSKDIMNSFLWEYIKAIDKSGLFDVCVLTPKMKQILNHPNFILNDYDPPLLIQLLKLDETPILIEIIKMYINSDRLNVNATDSVGRSVLMFNIDETHPNITDIILQSGKINLNIVNDKGETVTDVVVKKKRTSLHTKLILYPYLQKYQGNAGVVEFIKALGNNHFQTIIKLIENKQIKITNEIVKMVIDVRNIYVLNKLVNAANDYSNIDYSNIDYSNWLQDGNTLLTYSLKTNSIFIIYIILTHGTNALGYPSRNGERPLTLSLQSNGKNVITRLMLQHNNVVVSIFDVLIAINNKIENDIIEMLLQRLYKEKKLFVNYELFAKCLIESCKLSNHYMVYRILLFDPKVVNFKVMNPITTTPFLLVCSLNDPELVKLCIKFGADLNATNNNGYTPLMIASNKKENPNIQINENNEKIIDLLLNTKQINVNEQNKMDGKTALMLAVLKSNVSITKYLLTNKGADPYIMDVDGLNVYDMAVDKNIKNLLKPYFSTTPTTTPTTTTTTTTSVSTDVVVANNTITVTTNGLQIGHSTLQKISGPISFTILVPKNNQIGVDGLVKNIIDYEHQKITYGSLPVIMLFGDIHHSNVGMCGECKDDEECCTIYSNFFLKTLDSLSVTPKTPIDFYIERGKKYEDEQIQTGLEIGVSSLFKPKYAEYPLGKINENKGCFIRELRNTMMYTVECPTKKVRWHHIDARHMNSYEGVMSALYKLFLFEKDSNFVLEEILSIIDTLSGDEFIHYLDIFSTCFVEHFDFVSVMYNVNAFPIIKYTSLVYKQIMKMKGPLSNFDMWYAWIETYSKSQINETTANYFQAFSERIVLKNKELYRFYNQVSEEEYDPEHDLLFIYTDYISNQIMTTLIPALKEIKDDKKKMKKIFFDFVFENIINKNDGFPDSKTVPSTFLDLYFITRLYKMPENGEPSVLSLGYFGNAHCKGIKHFLTFISKSYNVYFSQTNEKEINYRCVNLPNLDFNQFIFNFKALETQMNNYYHSQLKSLDVAYSQYQQRRKEKSKKEEEKRKEIMKIVSFS